MEIVNEIISDIKAKAYSRVFAPELELKRRVETIKIINRYAARRAISMEDAFLMARTTLDPLARYVLTVYLRQIYFQL